MRPGIDPRVDFAFKRLFGSEESRPLLVDVLNAVIAFPPGKVVREVTLLNPFTQKDFAEEKVSVLDVRARDQAGRQFNVEMQLIVPWVFPRRALYYWAGLHAKQLWEGEDYHTLCATHSVCFLGQTLFEDDRYQRTCRILDEHGQAFGKDLEIHVLELNKFSLKAEEISTAVQRWCYFLNQAEGLDSAALPAALDLPIFHRAMEVLMKLSQDELERQRYLDRLAYQRDAVTWANAEKHALERGHEEGREQGELVGQILLCQKLLKQPQTPREELLRLPVEELTARAAELEQRLVQGTNGAG
jgi:predicted transposase/invertase (TIGR01784 family)